VAFCRERDDIDDFISELTEFDEQQLEQQAQPRSCEQREKLEQQGYSTDCRDEQMLEQREFPIEPDCRDEQKSEQQKQPHDYEQPEKLKQRGCPIERDCHDEQKSEQQEQPHDYEKPEKLKQRGCPIERDCRDEQKLEYPFECNHRGKHELEQRVSTNDCETTTGQSERPTRPQGRRKLPMPLAPSNVLCAEPRLSTVQASRRHARTYAGEAGLHGTIRSRLYHPRYGENPLCLNLDVLNDDVASEATTKKYDEELEQPDERIKKYHRELNAEKHQEKTTTDEPEQPDEPQQPAESIRTMNDRELHADSIRTTNDGEMLAESTGTANDGELHAESTGTAKDRELQAEKHQRLTAGTSARRGDGIPDNHGDIRGILEKCDTTPATV
jgi:hypothetical protein